MTRINTNIDSLVSTNNLKRTSSSLSTSLTKLTTGLKVDSGSDQPAGLVAGEHLKQELSSLNAAIQAGSRANNVLSTADAGLSQMGDLLQNLQDVVQSAANSGGLTSDQLAAFQNQFDSAVQSIDRIAGNTQFAGKKLLDGSLGFELTDVDSNALSNVRVDLANFPQADQGIEVTVNVQQGGRAASVSLAQTSADVDSVIQIQGNQGSATLQIAAGSDEQAIAQAINQLSESTGVVYDSQSHSLTSADLGSDAFVRVNNLQGNLLHSSEALSQGTDAVGTINGTAFTAQGNQVSLKSSNLQVSLTLSDEFASQPNASTSFKIEPGGTRFQLATAASSFQQFNVGLQSYFSSSLGTGSGGQGSLASLTSGGSNSLQTGTTISAGAIIESATTQISHARAQIGAIQKYTVETNVSSFQVAQQNLSAAKSHIVDTDFASEAATLTKNQILVQAGTSVLSIANSRPQSVLNLLGQ